MTLISDANDTATILADADTFFSSYCAEPDDVTVDGINAAFERVALRQCTEEATSSIPNYEGWGQLTSGLIQVYDLVLPLSVDRAQTYLGRLGVISDALLANRDDKRGAPEDSFRGRVMAAWGGFPLDRDCRWNTDVYSSGILAYAMAAFARRVCDRPALHVHLHDRAIAYATATIETYQAFRPELHLDDNDPFSFFALPASYSTLTCRNGAANCSGYRSGAGESIAYNENLSMIKALAELALATNSDLYRGSIDATPDRLMLGTEEAPLVIAKNVAYRAANLRAQTLDDLTPYYEWDKQWNASNEDMSHAQFELGSLAVILEDQVRLNALLAEAGRLERIPLNSSMFVRFANTFLRKVWHNNLLSHNVDGSGGEDAKYSVECAGWVPLSQFDPWVWTRCRDTTLQSPQSLRADNHGALLRYRRFNSMKFLTDFSAQNWLIAPAALAVGEAPPRSIRDQKWLLVLSGVVNADLKGDNSGQWNRQTVSFLPDMAGTDDPTSTSGPLNWVINKYSIQKPQGTEGAQYLIRFTLDEWSPSVSLGSIFNQGQSINSGHAVENFRPNHFDSGTDVITNQPVGNIFAGINVDLAVSDSDAWLYRLSYNITLLGKIVFIAPPVIS